jgi:hypothetical protein
MMVNDSRFQKDPDAVLDYKIDWTDWLEAAETISDHVITESTGITVDSSSLTDSGKSVTVWLSGGETGSDYTVTCHVTTSAGRQDDRTITILVRDR